MSEWPDDSLINLHTTATKTSLLSDSYKYLNYLLVFIFTGHICVTSWYYKTLLGAIVNIQMRRSVQMFQFNDFIIMWHKVPEQYFSLDLKKQQFI